MPLARLFDVEGCWIPPGDLRNSENSEGFLAVSQVPPLDDVFLFVEFADDDVAGSAETRWMLSDSFLASALDGYRTADRVAWGQGCVLCYSDRTGSGLEIEGLTNIPGSGLSVQL